MQANAAPYLITVMFLVLVWVLAWLWAALRVRALLQPVMQPLLKTLNTWLGRHTNEGAGSMVQGTHGLRHGHTLHQDPWSLAVLH